LKLRSLGKNDMLEHTRMNYEGLIIKIEYHTETLGRVLVASQSIETLLQKF